MYVLFAVHYSILKLQVSQNFSESISIIFFIQFFCPHGSNSFSPRRYAAISSCVVGNAYCALPGDGIPFSKRTNSYTANVMSSLTVILFFLA